jgi:hypothetical protein
MFTKLSPSFLGKQDTSEQDFWKTNEIQIGKYNPNARIAVQQNDVRYMEADLITLKPLPVNPNIVYELQKDAWKQYHQELQVLQVQVQLGIIPAKQSTPTSLPYDEKSRLPNYRRIILSNIFYMSTLLLLMRIYTRSDRC